MKSKEGFEVVIVGAGIAGASLAYFLSERGMTDVLILERESQPGYHATGRSAASLVEFSLDPAFSGLIIRSAAFLRDPPPGFSRQRLLEPSGIMVMFEEPLWSMVRERAPLLEEQGTVVELLSPSQVIDRVPALSTCGCAGGVLLPQSGHIDVRTWPLVQSLSPTIYFGPESAGLLASPSEEEAMEPCDAQPDDLVVAETMERLEQLVPSLGPGHFVASGPGFGPSPRIGD